jgi:sterol desaturase/sphingolipid hydroxylase (fatty acid hydroxylase superfamily)
LQGVPIILTLILIEAIVSQRKKLRFYEFGDSCGTMGLLFGNILTSVSIQSTIVGLHFYLYQFRLLSLSDILAPWQVWAITFLAIDFIFYWYQRASHRVRVLWAIHMNHHSSIEINFSVVFRQAWFGSISKVPFLWSCPLSGLIRALP